MEYAIAIYRSRNVSMRAYNFLVRNGYTAALVSTPRAANVGCGLSVKFSPSILGEVSQTLSRGETFVGFYLVRNTYTGTLITRL